jgi:hypothetical protein
MGRPDTTRNSNNTGLFGLGPGRAGRPECTPIGSSFPPGLPGAASLLPVAPPTPSPAGCLPSRRRHPPGASRKPTQAAPTSSCTAPSASTSRAMQQRIRRRARRCRRRRRRPGLRSHRRLATTPRCRRPPDPRRRRPHPSSPTGGTCLRRAARTETKPSRDPRSRPRAADGMRIVVPLQGWSTRRPPLAATPRHSRPCPTTPPRRMRPQRSALPRRPRPSSASAAPTRITLPCVRVPSRRTRPQRSALPRRPCCSRCPRPSSASAAPTRSALPGVRAPSRRTRPQRSALPSRRPRPHVQRPAAFLHEPPSSPVPATSSPTWIPCAPLPCVGIFARAAPCHRASHLLIACADAPAAPPTSFSRRRCRQHPLPGPAQAPVRLDTLRRPPPSPSLDPSLPQPSRPDPRCCDLSGSIRRPFGWIASSRLDPSLPWPSRLDLPFPPFYSAAGANTLTGADARAAVGLPGGAR